MESTVGDDDIVMHAHIPHLVCLAFASLRSDHNVPSYLIPYRLYFNTQLKLHLDKNQITEDVDTWWFVNLYSRDHRMNEIGSVRLFCNNVHHINFAKTGLNRVSHLWMQRVNYSIVDDDEMTMMTDCVKTMFKRIRESVSEEDFYVFVSYILSQTSMCMPVKTAIVSMIDVNRLMLYRADKLLNRLNMAVSIDNVPETKKIMQELYGSLEHIDHDDDGGGDAEDDDAEEWVDEDLDLDDDDDNEEFNSELESAVHYLGKAAATEGSLNVLKFLIGLGLNIHGNELGVRAAEFGMFETLKYLIDECHVDVDECDKVTL